MGDNFNGWAKWCLLTLQDSSFGRNFDAQILKTGKIHRKLKIKQTSVLFFKYLRKESSDLYEI